VALDDQIRAYLARIGRRGKARMRQVGSAEQAAFARAGWKGLTKKQRAKRAAKGWRTRTKTFRAARNDRITFGPRATISARIVRSGRNGRVL
jgi:hypothetical protein